MLVGCETYRMPDGTTRQVLSPVGQSLVQLGVSTAVGAGTGALMKNSPSWATGAVGGAAGSVASQVVTAFTAPQGGERQPTQYTGQQQVFGQRPAPQGIRNVFSSDQQYVQNPVAQSVQPAQQYFIRQQMNYIPVSFSQMQQYNGEVYIQSGNQMVRIR